MLRLLLKGFLILTAVTTKTVIFPAAVKTLKCNPVNYTVSICIHMVW